MATTGTYVASLTIANAFEEALERCGIDPERATIRHILSARRSMELMLKAWSNKALFQWAVELQTQTMTQGVNSFTLPVGSLDILTATLSRDGAETWMTVWARQEFHGMPRKDITGRPDRFHVQRDRDTVTCYVWPTPENSTDVMNYYRIRALHDVGAASNTPDIPQRYYDAFCGELAARVSEKWAPERYDALKARADEAFVLAKNEDRERAHSIFRPRLR